MHYRRLLRHGDPTIKRKPGPERSFERQALEASGSLLEMSPRRRDEHLAAWRLLSEYGDLASAITASARPNGTINTAKLRRLADAAVMTWVAEHGYLDDA